MVETHSQELKNTRGKKTKNIRRSPRKRNSRDHLEPEHSANDKAIRAETILKQRCRHRFGPPKPGTNEYFENATLGMIDNLIRPILPFLSRKKFKKFNNFTEVINWSKVCPNKVFLYAWEGHTFTKIGRTSNLMCRFKKYIKKNECKKIRLYGPF